MNPTPFAQHFKLKPEHERRTDLRIDPERDAQFYFDYSEVIPKVRTALNQSNQSLVVYGDFGTGKSHLLRHVEQSLAPLALYRNIYVTLDDLGKGKSFAQVHLKVAPYLLRALEDLFKASSDPLMLVEDAKQARSSLAVDDVWHALRLLAQPGLTLQDRSDVRAWFLGVGPTSARARKIGFASRLLEWAGPTELARLWRLVGALQRMADGRRLLLLLDEGEAFSDLKTSDAMASIAAGFRHLFDPDNEDIGCFVGLNLPRGRGAQAHPFSRSDITSRLAERQVELKHLSAQQVPGFVEAWWSYLAQPKPSRFLAREAVVLLQERWESMYAHLNMEGRAVRALTPRELLTILNFVAQRSFEAGHTPTLSADQLMSWFAPRQTSLL